MENKYITYGLTVLAVLLLVFGIFAYTTRVSKADSAAAIKVAQEAEAKKAKEQLDAINTAVDAKIAELSKTVADTNAALTQSNAKVTELETKLAQTTDTKDTSVTVDTVETYKIEDVSLSGNFSGTVANEELSTLAFDTISYNDDDYDIEETLKLGNSFKPLINFEDFGSDVVVQLDDDALTYTVSFDPVLDFVNGEDLTVKFLGKELIIVDLGTDELTYRTSNKVELTLNAKYTYNSHVISVIGFDDDSTNNKVIVKVDNDVASLTEGSTKDIGGIEVSADSIFISTIGDYNSAILYVGTETTKTVSDGEEFEDDTRYDWVIDSTNDTLTTLGLVLIETYVEDDEVLKLGDSISLPYDYKTLKFASLRELDVVDLTVSVRTDEIKFAFDGTVKIDGKKIDNSKFTFDGTNVTYDYRGDEKTSPLNEVIIYSGDREVLVSYNGTSDILSVGTYNFGYDFVTKKITSAPTEIDEDNDYRYTNGDVLYKSTIEDNTTTVTSVKIGFANDEAKEVIVEVY